MTNYLRPTALLCISLEVFACRGAGPEDLIVGEFVRIHKDDAPPLCGGNVSFMDAFVENFTATLGLEPGVIDMYFLASDSFGESGLCPPGSTACYHYKDNLIVSPDAPQLHELVHALLDVNGLLPDDFLAEGLADLYEENLPWENEDLEASINEVLSFEDTLTNSLPAPMHSRAAHFVRFLSDTYGPDAIRRLARHRVSGRPPMEQQSAFLDATGEDMELILAKYAQVEECSMGEFRRALVECSVPPAPWSEGPRRAWSTVVTLGCDRQDVVGPTRGIMWAVRALDIDEERLYSISVEGSGEDSAKIVLASCESSCERPLYFELGPGDTTSEVLPGGRYYVLLLRHVDDPGELGVVVEPTE